MARLPDLDSLGARRAPRAARSIATVRNADAIADAVGNAGTQIARTGDQILEREDKLSYAAAKSAVLKADAEARQELADDTDYATIEKRYSERMTKARASASALIKSNFDRRAFDLDTSTDIDRGTFEVRKIATNKKKAVDTGLFATTLEDLQATARLAQDDATREAAIATATEAISGAQANGLVDPLKAVELRQGWTDEYVSGQAMVALDKGDIEKARGIVDRFGKYLSNGNFLKLSAALNNEHDAQAVMTAASAGMGKPIVQADADVPVLVSRLFPGARVTDTDRDPASALGKANPGSHHNVRPGKGTKAIDVAPIEGVSFEQYVAALRANNVEVIEARDEVKNPSKHATGPHWHVAYKVGQAAAPDTAEQAVSRAVAALGPTATAKQVEAVRTEVINRWRLKDDAEKQHEENAVESVQASLIKNGGNWYALPASVRTSVNPKYVPGLINFGEGLAPSAPKRTTDPAEYVRLSTMAATDPKGFAALNPIEYRGKLDDADWEAMVDQRAKILGKVGDPTTPTTLETVRTIAKPLLASRGLTLTGVDRKKKPEDYDRIAGRIYGFEKAIMSDMAIWQQNNPGKKPSARDVQDMADRRMLTAIQGDAERFQFELQPGVPARVRIPAAARSRVAGLMRPVLGREPTETEIVQAYLREARGS